MRRLAGAALVSLMVLLMAVTPLSAFLSGGAHETWLPGFHSPTYSTPRTRVVLLDHTGLVRMISPAPEESVLSATALVVNWYGCGNSTLTFDRAAKGYVLAEPTAFPCGWFDGRWRAVTVHFNAPLDPALVRVDLPQSTWSGQPGWRLRSVTR